MVLEKIIKVAFMYRLNDKTIVFALPQPLRHHHIGWKYGRKLDNLRNTGWIETQGFLTNTHRFVNRKEGLLIAEKCNQIIKKHPCYDELYSEDMWGSSNKSKTQYLPK